MLMPLFDKLTGAELAEAERVERLARAAYLAAPDSHAAAAAFVAAARKHHGDPHLITIEVWLRRK